MYYFPLGELKEDRYEFSKKYRLVELVNGVHRLTDKTRRYYDQVTFIKYLRGEVEKPKRLDAVKEVKTAPEIKNDPQEFKNPDCQAIINEILSL